LSPPLENEPTSDDDQPGGARLGRPGSLSVGAGRQEGNKRALWTSRATVGHETGPPCDRVTAELRLGRSPLAIWADFLAKGAERRVCVESIYAAVYGGDAVRPVMIRSVLTCSTCHVVLWLSVTKASSATRRVTRSSGQTTFRRCCG
jgi:hypothetical protein